MPDFLITDHGSIITIAPGSEATQDWLDEDTVSEPRQWQGGVLCVDHRCARDLIDAIEVAGFDIPR